MSTSRLRALVAVLATLLALADAAVTTAAPSVPVVTAISASGRFTCAVLATGAVKCWGDNAVGQLGTTSVTNSALPLDVAGLPSDVTSVAAGGGHACALTRRGGVMCWGSNYNGA